MRSIMDYLLPYLGAIKAVMIVAVLLATFAAGMKVMGWRKDAEISALKAAQANDKAIQATGALEELVDAAKIIHTAAGEASVNVASLGLKLDALQRSFKNARPLPTDCKPDDFRLRHLASAVDAVKQALAGQQPGPAVQDSGRP